MTAEHHRRFYQTVGDRLYSTIKQQICIGCNNLTKIVLLHYRRRRIGILLLKQERLSAVRNEVLLLNRVHYLHLRGGLDERLMAHGLGAVPAVFGATASLDGQKRALLDLCGVEKHAVYSRCPVQQLQHGHVVHLPDLFLRPVLSGC